MRQTTKQTGIISYAGLDKDALWAKAKRAFAQAEESVPERYASFLPVFPIELVQNMSYVGAHEGNRAPVSPAGFSIDPAEYHQKLYEQMPELYKDDNYRRNFDYEGRCKAKGVVAVDHTWATYFPQYQPFMGERLVVHMIGGGHQAVAVPESVYPRGCGILRGAELDMRVTARCAHVCGYFKVRLESGEKYDPQGFEEDYLKLNELLPVCIRQVELGRVMQDLSILKTLQGEQSGAGLFTENAKRAEHITQYVPFRCACDTFESAPVTRATARLLQLHYQGDSFVSDFWLPYQDASEYIDKRCMELNVQALCEGFQIAPAYDPETGGGRYPDEARVAVVRDRGLRPMVAETLNNPAYGGGMNPMGMINRLVFLPDSAELLRQHKLALEDARLACRNTLVCADGYQRMAALASLQEHKGKLVDAMYRREAALSQMQPDSRAYERARALLDDKVNALDILVKRGGNAGRRGQLSGYDADIEYLGRMQRLREGVPEDGEPEPVVFAEDSLRELSIESGYAMRNGVRLFGLTELYEAQASEEEEADSEASAPLAPPPSSGEVDLGERGEQSQGQEQERARAQAPASVGASEASAPLAPPPSSGEARFIERCEPPEREEQPQAPASGPGEANSQPLPSPPASQPTSPKRPHADMSKLSQSRERQPGSQNSKQSGKMAQLVQRNKQRS